MKTDKQARGEVIIQKMLVHTIWDICLCCMDYINNIIEQRLANYYCIMYT